MLKFIDLHAFENSVYIDYPENCIKINCVEICFIFKRLFKNNLFCGFFVLQIISEVKVSNRLGMCVIHLVFSIHIKVVNLCK